MDFDELLPLDFGYYEDEVDYSPATTTGRRFGGSPLKREREASPLDIEGEERSQRQNCWSPPAAQVQVTPDEPELDIFDASSLGLDSDDLVLGKTRSLSIDLQQNIEKMASKSRSLSFDLMQTLFPGGTGAPKLFATAGASVSPRSNARMASVSTEVPMFFNMDFLKPEARNINNKGSRQCVVDGCIKNGQGASKKCIAHGGGRRCKFTACTKSAQGSTDLCKAHGGGKRCEREECTKSARGATGLCKAHGGGRRCHVVACGKSAASGSYKCITHGGGRKCCEAACTKSAAGSTKRCKAHGGGRRCIVDGCTKSSQGAAHKCIAHGGGRRCSVTSCHKSAQGATDRCKAHGGGRRCNRSDCNKSRFRCLDYCKAHGGPTVDLLLAQERERSQAAKEGREPNIIHFQILQPPPEEICGYSDDELF